MTFYVKSINKQFTPGLYDFRHQTPKTPKAMKILPPNREIEHSPQGYTTKGEHSNKKPGKNAWARSVSLYVGLVHQQSSSPLGAMCTLVLIRYLCLPAHRHTTCKTQLFPVSQVFHQQKTGNLPGRTLKRYV